MADNSISFAIIAKNLASGEFDKVARSATGLKDSVEGTHRSVAKLAVGIGGAVGGLALLSNVFRTGTQELKDYQAGYAQLQAGLKSTNDASGMTARGLENLATKIQGYSGQTDDSIVKSESLLLTFRNIHDQTGKNNDIFTQATKLTADMAARFGGEASDNAVKLGRALNDPVKGLSALSRMGIQFTDGQKAQIAAMEKSGNVLGAQKLVIDQVTKAVGGSAAAYGKTLPGQVDIAHRKFEDLSQSLTTKLTPAFNLALTGATKTIDIFSKYGSIILPAAAAIGTLVIAIKIATASQALYAIATKTSTIATKDMTKAQWLLTAAMDADPIILAVAAIAALTVGLVIAYKKSETFRNIVQSTFGWIKDHWPLLVQIIGAPIEPLVQLGLHFNLFKRLAIEAIREVLRSFLDLVSGILHGAASAFGWVPKIGDKLKGARDAFDTFKKGVLDDLNSLEGTHEIHVNVRTAASDTANAISLPHKAGQYNYASGGLIRGPGGPRSDSILARISNGEAVIPAHLVPEIAPWAAARGIPGFAGGGLVVQTNAATAANGLGDQLRSIVDGMLSRMAAAFSFGGGSGGAGVQRWAGLVSQVLAMLGLSPLLVGKVLSQMATESGGNPNAINLTDSNAAAGHPSQGLMQTIPGTFAAYAGPFANLGILNPLANIYAGVNYAAHRYGPGLAGLGEGHGYANGGVAQGWAWVGERGPELIHVGSPSRVLNHRDSMAAGGINVNIYGGVFADQHSKRKLAQEIAVEINKIRANGGALPVGA